MVAQMADYWGNTIVIGTINYIDNKILSFDPVCIRNDRVHSYHFDEENQSINIVYYSNGGNSNG